MRARAVVGSNFGDEGKGLVVDYLCATQGADFVVRFNGGCQAGHTVVTPDGRRHVFGHFGAGSFLGVPTYLSRFFVCNPIAFFEERARLKAVKLEPKVYAHPDCLVTTFADILINRRLEDKRGPARHGSCGMGVNETVIRSEVEELRITMRDLWERDGRWLEARLDEICSKWAVFRSGEPVEEPRMTEAFIGGCSAFADTIEPMDILKVKDPVFEGAQGLLLDQDNKKFFPHVTRSNTGLKNVRTLCAEACISGITAYYVSRTYLTRHGAGPFPGEDPKMRFQDDTNLDHPYQGPLRFAPLDDDAMRFRCADDAKDAEMKLVYTHLDQLDPWGSRRFPDQAADLFFAGPTREDVFQWEKVSASR